MYFSLVLEKMFEKIFICIYFIFFTAIVKMN